MVEVGDAQYHTKACRGGVVGAEVGAYGHKLAAVAEVEAQCIVIQFPGLDFLRVGLAIHFMPVGWEIHDAGDADDAQEIVFEGMLYQATKELLADLEVLVLRIHKYIQSIDAVAVCSIWDVTLHRNALCLGMGLAVTLIGYDTRNVGTDQFAIEEADNLPPWVEVAHEMQFLGSIRFRRFGVANFHQGLERRVMVGLVAFK